MATLRSGETVIATGSIEWNEQQQGWQVGNTVYADPGRIYTLVPSLVLSPIQFKLCFTSEERIAIQAARATDPIIDDFYDILDDSRLTEVDLSLSSTQNGVGYLALQGLIAPARVAQILSGTLV